MVLFVRFPHLLLQEVSFLKRILSLSLFSLPPSRWFLPLQHHQGEAHHQVRALPSAKQTTRGALCPSGAVSAGPGPSQWRGRGSRGSHALLSSTGPVLLHHRLQVCRCQNQPLPLSPLQRESPSQDLLKRSYLEELLRDLDWIWSLSDELRGFLLPPNETCKGKS